MKRFLWTAFKYGLAFGLLGYVIYSNWDPPSGQGLKKVWYDNVLTGDLQFGFLALAGCLSVVGLFITFMRWFVLVRAQDLPFTVPDAVRLGLVGFFFNTFLPGSVGGDIVKAAFLAREQSRRTVAVATVIMDRLIALWALVWFVALTGGLFWALGWLRPEVAGTLQNIVTMAASVVGVSLLVWIALGFLPDRRAERFAGRLEKLPRVGPSAAEFWRAVWMYRKRPASVALALLLTWGGQFAFVSFFYCCVRTILPPGGGDAGQPPLLEHFLLVPIGLVIRAMPLFPGGAGIGELGFGGLYQLVGAPAALGILGSLVQRVVEWVMGAVGYVVYLRMKPVLATPSQDATPEPELAVSRA